jgi:hypothetical protein
MTDPRGAATTLISSAARTEHACKDFGRGDTAVRALADVTLDIPR